MNILGAPSIYSKITRLTLAASLALALLATRGSTYHVPGQIAPLVPQKPVISSEELSGVLKLVDETGEISIFYAPFGPDAVTPTLNLGHLLDTDCLRRQHQGVSSLEEATGFKKPYEEIERALAGVDPELRPCLLVIETGGLDN